MSGVPCEHACAVIKHLTQNIVEFVDDMFKCPTQQKIYSGMFCGIEIHDIPKVYDNGVVWDVVGNVYFSLKCPRTKRPLGRRRKK